MCFSATSSFGTAALLLGIGAWSIAKTTRRKQVMFASIPLIFSSQQVIEGIVWLTLQCPDVENIHKTAVYLFLFFALSVWPSWIPISLYLVEPIRERRMILGALASWGVIISGYAIYLLTAFPVNVEIIDKSLAYTIGLPPSWLPVLYLLLYSVPTVIPFFVSSTSLMKLAGISILASLLLTFIIKWTTFISIWCFFAALLSILVIILVDQMAIQTSKHGR